MNAALHAAQSTERSRVLRDAGLRACGNGRFQPNGMPFGQSIGSKFGQLIF
jgi:hypothetical protein